MRGRPIHPKQIRIIKMAQRQLGLDDSAYRDLLEKMFGETSCKALSADQANELIDELQKKGFALVTDKKPREWPSQGGARGQRPAGTPRGGAKVVGLATAAELSKIDALAGLIAWQYEDGLQRWLKARFGLDRVRTSGEAYRVIEGLKKMFENAMLKAHGEDWWMIRFENEAVEDYIGRHAPAELRDSKGKVFKRSEA